MNREEFAEQAKCRKEEIEEMEYIVASYAKNLKCQQLLKGSMISAFRDGMASCLSWLDAKAVTARNKRQFAEKLLKDTRGQ